jgi:hypothetical protein
MSVIWFTTDQPDGRQGHGGKVLFKFCMALIKTAHN